MIDKSLQSAMLSLFQYTGTLDLVNLRLCHYFDGLYTII